MDKCPQCGYQEPKSKSVWDLVQEAKDQYKTRKNTFDMFPIGTRVKVITPCQDFNFFWGETGKVISNGKKYLTIQVEWDDPRHFTDGYIETGWGFNPDDLIVLSETMHDSPLCENPETWKVSGDEGT